MSAAEIFGALWWCSVVILGPVGAWYLFRAAYMAGRKDGRKEEQRKAEQRHQNSGARVPALPILK